MGSSRERMKLALVVLSAAAIASVYSVAEIVELGVDAAVASGVDCDSVRASLPSICKIMPEQCATMKNKLRTSCAAQPEELIQTAAKQAPANDEANFDADDDMGEAGGKGRRVGGGGFLSTSGSFTMSNRAGNSEEMNEEQDLGESAEETSQDWDSQMSCKAEEARMPTDATDEKLGRCVEFAADTKCSPQCFHRSRARRSLLQDLPCAWRRQRPVQRGEDGEANPEGWREGGRRCRSHGMRSPKGLSCKKHVIQARALR